MISRASTPLRRCRDFSLGVQRRDDLSPKGVTLAESIPTIEGQPIE